MSTLPDIARTAVVRHGMLPDGAPVLALVSGGADSTALLRLLAAGELGDRPLAVLHVDHMLRGADSDADAAFVEALCVDLGVERRVARRDGPCGLALRDDDFVDLLQEGANVLLREGVRFGEARRGDAGLRGVQHLTGAAAARSTVAVVVEIDVSHEGGV